MDIDAILLAAKGPKGDDGDPTLSADLASTDPGKGAELVSRGSVTVSSFADIADVPASVGARGISINLRAYHSDNNKGGGVFDWDATSTDTDDGGTIVTPSGHSGPGRWVRRIADYIDVTWFGARGAIVDDASDAMEAAIKRARVFVGASPINNGGLRIYAPKGEYRFTRSVFSYNPEQSLWGAMIYEGDGPFSTYFLLDPQTPNDEWFYNSSPLALGGDGRSFYTLHFTGVGFASTGSNRQYANGFLYYSTGFEKNFSFDNCSFGYGADGSTERPLKILMYACGTGNADQVVWTNCKIRRITDCVLQINNNQSIGFGFFGVQCIGYESDLVRILSAGEDSDFGAGGGGMVRWIGGAIDQRRTDTGYDRYLVNIVGGGGILNTTLYFHPDQLEFSNENGRIFKKGGTLGYVKCEFKGAKFDAIDADANDYVVAEIGQGAELIFSECVIRENMIFDITNPAGSQASPEPGALIFQNCTIPEDLSKRITFGGNPYTPWNSAASTGFVEAVRCNIKNAQLLVTKYTNSSNGCGDFTLGNQVAQTHGRGNRVKIGTLKRNSGNSWPIDAANALSFIMPYNATIIGFKVYKPAYASSDTGDYQLSVGPADRLTTYAQSQLALWKDAHAIDIMLPVEDWIFVGTDENLRKVDLWPNVAEGVTGQTYAAGGVPVVAQVIYI